MNTMNLDKKRNKNIRFAVGIGIAWTLVIVFSFSWHWVREYNAAEKAAWVTANASIDKDIIYRRWNAEHGGVYAPITETTQPNPYLTQVKERDISTPSGKPLTLINPAYMTRQVHELGWKAYGVRGHITSLKPIRPQNAPDDWEKAALETFTTGDEKYSSIEIIGGERYIRLIRPFVTQKECLKCHAHQGYQVGDIRGGVSVSTPMAPYESIAENLLFTAGVRHAGIWFLGIIGLTFTAWRLHLQSRQQADFQAALQEKENRMELALAGAELGTWDWDIKSGKLVLNRRWSEMLGYNEGEIEPHLSSWEKLVHPHDMPLIQTSLEDHLSGRADWYETEHRMKHKSGEWVWILDKGRVIERSPSGNPIRACGTHLDINARKQAENRQKIFFANLEKINCAIRQADNIADMLQSILDTTRAILSCDRALLVYPCSSESETYKIPAESTCVKEPLSLTHNHELTMTDAMRRDIIRTLQSNEPVVFDRDIKANHACASTPDPSSCSRMIMSIRPKSGKPWLFALMQYTQQHAWTNEEQTLFKEIGHRLTDGISGMLFWDELRRSEKRYRTLVENIPGATYRAASDENWTMEFLSDEVETLTGYPCSDFINNQVRSFASIIHSDDAPKIFTMVQNSIKNKEPFTLEYRITHADGQLRWILEKGKPIFNDNNELQHLEGVMVDITKQKNAAEKKTELETQLRQAQKMQAIGQLAGGVAHDFNNLLTAILGNSEALLSSIADGADEINNEIVKSGLHQIQSAGKQAAALTDQLLAFSRRDSSQAGIIDLNRVVGDMAGLLRGLVNNNNIKLDINLDAESPLVLADAGHIERILLNLVVNAADAMPDGGDLEIIVADDDLREITFIDQTPIKPGRHVILTVKDNGTGMTAETLERAFEPFFTTKPVGKGTGLGLATVFGTVEQLQGHISASSDLDQGTCFRIAIPVIEAKPNTEAQIRDKNATKSRKTVCVCVEEDLTRKMILQTLRSAEFLAIEVDCSQATIDKIPRQIDKIDLLIIDEKLPETDGRELAIALTEFYPDMESLFISAHSSEHHDDAYGTGSKAEVVTKPFGPTVLLRHVREMINRKRI